MGRFTLLARAGRQVGFITFYFIIVFIALVGVGGGGQSGSFMERMNRSFDRLFPSSSFGRLCCLLDGFYFLSFGSDAGRGGEARYVICGFCIKKKASML